MLEACGVVKKRFERWLVLGLGGLGGAELGGRGVVDLDITRFGRRPSVWLVGCLRSLVVLWLDS